jgi:hypothetical protein
VTTEPETSLELSQPTQLAVRQTALVQRGLELADRALARLATPPNVAAPAQPGGSAQRIVYDLRGATVDLAQLPSPATATWYAEGGQLESNAPTVAYAPRTAIAPAPDRPLVLWSAPPSPELLRWLVTTTAAPAIYLVAHPTHDDGWYAVLRQVAAMCKYVLLSREGAIDVGRMAARLGVTEAIICRSLLWMEASGLVVFEWLDDDRALIALGSGPEVTAADAARAVMLQAELEELLAKVRAYRQFVRRARVESLEI